jgi:beta-glucosidase
VLVAWNPGPDGGRTVTELIMGDREPAGRLPVSLPRSSATLPVAYNERLETARRYVDAETGTDFPFGSGRGYTSWLLGEPELSPGDEPAALTVSATLTNTGERAGRQLVQLYGRALVPGLLPRRAVLLGFIGIEAAAGAESVVAVPVDPDALPGLGLPADGGLSLELWLSIDGPARPEKPLRWSPAPGIVPARTR